MFKFSFQSRAIRQLLCVAIFAMAVWTILPPNNKACAQTYNLESNVCDPDIWKTMVGRAWMEAQREVEISKSFIRRPASVLATSCFDAWAHHSAGVVGAIFSGDGNGSTLQVQVGNAAVSAVAQYMAFQGYTGAPLSGTGASGDFYGPTVGSSMSSQCKMMQNMWLWNKCSNMIDFNGVIFDQMRSNDPREFFVGQAAQTCTDAGGGSTLYDAAGVWEDVLESLNTPAVAAANPNYFDVVQTFSTMTSPTGACSAPIPTGVTIVQTDGSTTPEMVCPNPGCSYNGASCAR